MTQRGSIFQRSNGRWVASVRVGAKTIQRYGATRAEADSKLAELLKEHFRGTLVAPAKTTLSEWFDQWLSELELRPSTLRTYRQVTAPVLADAGAYRLDKLTPVVLSLTFTKLAKRGMGARQRQLAHGYLKSCLGRAVELDLLGQNPVLKVRRPEWQPNARVYWTPEQAAGFISTCQRSRLRWSPLLTILAACGLRMSEALGLRGSDVDLRSCVLHVRRALVWSGGQYHEGAVKSRAGLRSVTLPDVAVSALERNGLPDDPSAPVFRTGKGQPPTAGQLRRPLLALCKAAGVPAINVHGLRHVHAAMVYHSTRDVYAVRARLGHADVSFTMRQYAYGMASDVDTAAALDRLLNQQHGEVESDTTP